MPTTIALFLTLWAILVCQQQALPFMNMEELEKMVATGIAAETGQTQMLRSLQRRRAPISSNNPSTFADFLTQLDTSIWPCRNDRTLDGPLTRRLLNESVQRWIGQVNGTEVAGKDGQMALLVTLAQLFSKHPYIAVPGRTLPPNSTITTQPLVQPDSSGPVFAFQLACDYANPHWIPLAVYPTTNSHSFLQVKLPKVPLDACPHSRCPTHCSYSMHGGVRVFARSCCREDERMALPTGGGRTLGDAMELCREDWIMPIRIFMLISAICMFFCIIMIGVVVRERRRQQHDRGWALMEPFFAGAFILYAIPLLGWPLHLPWSCWMAIFGRQLGFTLFYGSVILKIYRNLQEYRVRKAQHVIVRELDLIFYLLFALFVVIYGILAWSSGSWGRPELWSSDWPQCPVEEFTLLFSLCEQLALLYGIRLCYKARNSSWIERYQFTMALILEALISLIISAIRYTLSDVGSRDTLFLVAIIQLHLTISVNIAAIITPKFLISSDSTRRALGNTSGLGSSGRAHPSLAKMRENLINGTIDFQEVPIVDMNPEDIRAELKRVYTQLRMYKLKNAYQDNPHISKRKGGGAKKIQVQASTNEPPAGKPPIGAVGKATRAGSAAAAVDRRISIPPNALQHQNASNSSFAGSPKLRRDQQRANNDKGGDNRIQLLELAEEEKNDLTVESAPHNVHLLTTSAKMGPPPLVTTDQQSSIRV